MPCNSPFIQPSCYSSLYGVSHEQMICITTNCWTFGSAQLARVEPSVCGTSRAVPRNCRTVGDCGSVDAASLVSTAVSTALASDRRAPCPSSPSSRHSAALCRSLTIGWVLGVRSPVRATGFVLTASLKPAGSGPQRTYPVGA
jgi:hypothetical protein